MIDAWWSSAPRRRFGGIASLRQRFRRCQVTDPGGRPTFAPSRRFDQARENEERPKDLADVGATSMLQPRRIDRTGRPRNEEFDMRRGSAFSRFAGGCRTIVGGVTIMAAMTIAMASAGIVSARSDSAAVREPVGNTSGSWMRASAVSRSTLGSCPTRSMSSIPRRSRTERSTCGSRERSSRASRNTDTGKSVTENVGGPATVTIRPDGVVTFDGQGLAWFWFDAVGRAATGEPGLVFTAGHAVDRLDPGSRRRSVLQARRAVVPAGRGGGRGNQPSRRIPA